MSRRGDGISRRGDSWQYRFEGAKIDGKRQTISKSGFKSYKEAMDAKIKAMAEFQNSGDVVTPSEISVSDYLDKWLSEECKNKKKATTVKNYEKIIRLDLKPVIGKYKLRSLSHSTLQKLIDDLFNDGRSRNSISVIYGILRSSLEYAVVPLRYIPSNPMEHVKLPSKRAEGNAPTNEKKHVYITKEQIDRILERFPEGSSAYLPIIIGYRCGLRIGEVYALTWDDIDLENKTLSVNKQVQWQSSGNKSGYWYFSAPKYDSYRVISIDDSLVRILSEEKEKQEKRALGYFDDEYTRYYEVGASRKICSDGEGKELHFVMIRENGTYIQPRTMQHASHVIHTELGFPEFDFHSLRYTHCTVLMDNKADPKYVQERLGHKNIMVTLNVYRQYTENMKKQGDELLNKVFDDTDVSAAT